MQSTFGEMHMVELRWPAFVVITQRIGGISTTGYEVLVPRKPVSMMPVQVWAKLTLVLQKGLTEAMNFCLFLQPFLFLSI